jgi:hypothetical protein
MKLMSNGKVRRTAEEWRQIITQWKRSGLSPEAFCQRESLQLSSFQRWHLKVNGSSGRQDFVEVTAASPSASTWALEVTLPNGSKLHFRG